MVERPTNEGLLKFYCFNGGNVTCTAANESLRCAWACALAVRSLLLRGRRQARGQQEDVALLLGEAQLARSQPRRSQLALGARQLAAQHAAACA